MATASSFHTNVALFDSTTDYFGYNAKWNASVLIQKVRINGGKVVCVIKTII